MSPSKAIAAFTAILASYYALGCSVEINPSAARSYHAAEPPPPSPAASFPPQPRPYPHPSLDAYSAPPPVCEGTCAPPVGPEWVRVTVQNAPSLEELPECSTLGTFGLGFVAPVPDTCECAPTPAACIVDYIAWKSGGNASGEYYATGEARFADMQANKGLESLGDCVPLSPGGQGLSSHSEAQVNPLAGGAWGFSLHLWNKGKDSAHAPTVQPYTDYGGPYEVIPGALLTHLEPGEYTSVARVCVADYGAAACDSGETCMATSAPACVVNAGEFYADEPQDEPCPDGYPNEIELGSKYWSDGRKLVGCGCETSGTVQCGAEVTLYDNEECEGAPSVEVVSPLSPLFSPSYLDLQSSDAPQRLVWGAANPSQSVDWSYARVTVESQIPATVAKGTPVIEGTFNRPTKRACCAAPLPPL